jgi:hypothetical protein
MKLPRIILTLAAALSLCSCAPIMPRQVAYNEAAFTSYRGSGSGGVSGTVDSNTEVSLMPHTDYTEEIVRRDFTNGERLEPADPRFGKYVRTVTSDDNGNFLFTRVRAGDYYVYYDKSYESTFDETNSDGSSTLVPETDYEKDYARISVRSGETTKVNNWSVDN